MDIKNHRLIPETSDEGAILKLAQTFAEMDLNGPLDWMALEGAIEELECSSDLEELDEEASAKAVVGLGIILMNEFDGQQLPLPLSVSVSARNMLTAIALKGLAS